MVSSYQAALADFQANDARRGWSSLAFFTSGRAETLGQQLDQHAANGREILPSATDLLTALRHTAPQDVRVVILGQDPYPTPGHAHGLAFSVQHGVKAPRSLANIFKEREADLGIPPAYHGNLSAWAKQGVLLLNACLTVEAGLAGAHRTLGWDSLTREVIAHVANQGAVFILWGADADRAGAEIDPTRNHIIRSVHPSPLSARRGFFGSKPFSRANAWLLAQGQPVIDWRS